MGLPEDYRLPANHNETYHLTGDGCARRAPSRGKSVRAVARGVSASRVIGARFSGSCARAVDFEVGWRGDFCFPAAPARITSWPDILPSAQTAGFTGNDLARVGRRWRNKSIRRDAATEAISRQHSLAANIDLGEPIPIIGCPHFAVIKENKHDSKMPSLRETLRQPPFPAAPRRGKSSARI